MNKSITKVAMIVVAGAPGLFLLFEDRLIRNDIGQLPSWYWAALSVSFVVFWETIILASRGDS